MEIFSVVMLRFIRSEISKIYLKPQPPSLRNFFVTKLNHSSDFEHFRDKYIKIVFLLNVY